MFSNKLNFKQEQNLRLSLKMWIPMLQSSLSEMEKSLKEVCYDNPFLNMVSSTQKQKNALKSNYSSLSSYTSKEFIDELVLNRESLFEKVASQITPPIFPTPKSQNIAYDILDSINSQGYFEGSIKQIAIKNSVYESFVDSIRERFSNLEPRGVGATDLKESFLFQLNASEDDMDDELYLFCEKIINDFQKIDRYTKHHRFEEAKNIIKKFVNPPALEYMENSVEIIPDFFVEVDNDIKIKLNSDYYPDLIIEDFVSVKNDALKEKLKEARDIVNLLELKKSTLYKIVLLIVQKQLHFFIGGELKPLTMQEIASELNFQESTISRAVNNKYLECSRGLFAFKDFFSNAVASKDLSSAEIKNYLINLIEYEDRETPLTDEEILKKMQDRFKIKIVRRTVTKYRKLLDIPSSKERKKLYKV